MAFVLAAEKLTSTDEQLLAALHRRGVVADVVLSAEVPDRVEARDTVLGRVALLPTLDGVQGCVWALRRLENRSVRILNPASALLATHDKLMTALRLARAGIAHPRTAHVDHGDVSLPELSAPLVVKPRFGSGGADVARCDDRATLRETLEQLSAKRWFRRQGALVQELVGSRHGRDTRLLVCRGDVVGAVSREAPSGWRADVSDARITPVDPTVEQQTLAIEAAAAFGADLVAVELLATDDGPVVLELDAAAEFDARYGLHGQDVFDEIAGRLIDGGHAATGESVASATGA